MASAIAAFGVVTYALSMYVVVANMAFNGNLVHYVPAVEPLLPYAVDGSAWCSHDHDWIGKRLTNRMIGNPNPTPLMALLWDLALIALFAITHSVMARPGTKRAMRSVIPEAAERSVFSFQASVLLWALMALWQPLKEPIVWVAPAWAHTPLLALQAAAVAFALSSTFAIDHFHLFGLRQALTTTVHHPDQEYKLQTHWHYTWMRHPLAVGLAIAWFAQPIMTLGHLFWSVVLTVYSAIAILYLEEPGLRDMFGAQWDSYTEHVSAFGVPAAMLCPMRSARRRKAKQPAAAASGKKAE